MSDDDVRELAAERRRIDTYGGFLWPTPKASRPPGKRPAVDPARVASSTRMTRAELLEEAEWMLSLGEHPAHIARTLGYAVRTILDYARDEGLAVVRTAFAAAAA